MHVRYRRSLIPGVILRTRLARLLRWLSLCCLASLATPLFAEPVRLEQGQPRIIVQTGHAAQISAAQWTPDGAFLVTGSTDGQLLVWDLAGRIVNRTALGPGGDRTIVEKIVVAADGTGAQVDEIEFRDMYDNGVGSEVYRRHYTVVFGAERSAPSESQQVDPPWGHEVSFLNGSLGLKNALLARTDWPVSKQGWKLTKLDGQLALRSPDTKSPLIALRGSLGFDPDQGDDRLEARARRIDELGQAIDRNASIAAENERLCGPDDSKRCTFRKPFTDIKDKLATLEEGGASVSLRPLLSPDGKRLAWIDRNGAGASGWWLRILDLDRGTTRSARFEAPIGGVRIGWKSAAMLVARTQAGDFEVDQDSAVPNPVATLGCIPLPVDEIARQEVQNKQVLSGIDGCAKTPAAVDARLAVRLTADKGMVRVNDAASGNFVCMAFLDESEIILGALALSSNDGRWILLQSAQGYTELFTIPERALQNAAACPPGTDCAAAPASDSQLRKNKCPAPAALRADPGRVGFHPTLPLLWMETRGGRLDFYHTARIATGFRSEGLGAPLFTLFRLPGGRFFAIDPEGRYDTNLPPDSKAVRWTMPDAPLQSLAPQIFMRDYYLPGLMRRLIDCSALPGVDCTKRLPPIPSLASLNRVLPKVRIVGVRQGKTPAEAIVSVEVADGHDPAPTNGKTATGVYDVRLFRNNRLVFPHPNQVFVDLERRIAEFDRIGKSPLPGETPYGFLQANPDFNQRRPEFVAQGMRKDIAMWRSLSQVNPDPVKGYPVLDFHVNLPTAAGSEESVFSAYAFNEDRVKSDTAQFTYRRPPTTIQKPRAFVVSIGIDAYDSPRLQLQFAASDAALIAERLAQIPGYEVRRLTLAGKRSADGKTAHITREAIEIMFSAMGGADVPVSASYLEEQGIDASQLDHVQPDDIVIVAFSGHGWADPQGNFYLLPADAKWPDGADAPDTSTLLSSTNLAVYLGSIHAAEIALVIDACHSAASVAGGDFRPGPMGDSGLGQLAFDKGIRILAATQTDDVALEDPVLRQGLLTYALAGEGITANGGKADDDGDGRITLDEWLAYATKRMPSLSSDVRLGRLTTAPSGARGWVRVNAGATKPAMQEPSLFDFNAKPSGVVLKEGIRR